MRLGFFSQVHQEGSRECPGLWHMVGPYLLTTLLVLTNSGFPGGNQGQPEVLPPPRSLPDFPGTVLVSPARVPRHSSFLLSLVLITLLWVRKGTVVPWSPNTVRPVLLTLMPPPGARQLGTLGFPPYGLPESGLCINFKVFIKTVPGSCTCGSSTEDTVPALCSPQELSCTVELDAPGSVPSRPHSTLSSGTEQNWQGGRTGFSPPGDHPGATQP